ncbi:hypothetical protein B5G12_13415 [Faecalibacterium sp. An58]|uniref:restriction endonuclease subunit S n=1 Tax=Faecalibacterium sp. An58 TaxID=1965648 RepID=UPI000B37FA65|nr:restriction endonuclease subunit S [Faecalibacterium sp. An58]OUN67827.1 hypothetical protein B5G12_13415 [Faecalibacterium sp. An58]
MTPQELKNSILQLAIQGKLVEQRPEEGTAQELYAQIQAEKQRLIKEGKLKKEKPLPEITENEKPFDIPDEWMWVRIGQIFNLQAGKNITATDIYDEPSEKHKYLCYGGNGVRGYVSRFNREGNFALIGRQGALCGNINIANGQFYATEHAVVVDHYNLTDVLWGGWFLKALNLNQYATATAQPGLAVSNIIKVLIPLPPLAEQKRIVAKIEELLPLVDRYEQAWTKLENFNRRFPEDMKKSILQQAIQGKLVEQRPEEGTAQELYAQIQAEKQRLIQSGKLKKEKPLPEITEDEKPFEIPEGWMWVNLGSVVLFENGDRSNKYPVEKDYTNFGIPFFGAKDMGKTYMQFDNVRYISKNKFEELGNGKLHNQDFVCLLRGSVGKVAIFKADTKHQTGFICAQMVIIRCINLKMVNYLQHLFGTEYYARAIAKKITGTAVRQLPAKELAKIFIPLPPLAEQKRIVEKLEELLAMCERLKK